LYSRERERERERERDRGEILKDDVFHLLFTIAPSSWNKPVNLQ